MYAKLPTQEDPQEQLLAHIILKSELVEEGYIAPPLSELKQL